MTLARRYRNGKPKDRTPFKLGPDGLPVNVSRLAKAFKPPAKLLPPRAGPPPSHHPDMPLMVSKRRLRRRK